MEPWASPNRSTGDPRVPLSSTVLLDGDPAGTCRPLTLDSAERRCA